MAEYLIQGETLTGIADAIRSKTGGTDPIAPEDMATRIAGIEVGNGSGGDVVGTCTVTIECEDGIDVKVGYTGKIYSDDPWTYMTVNASSRLVITVPCLSTVIIKIIEGTSCPYYEVYGMYENDNVWLGSLEAYFIASAIPESEASIYIINDE